MGKIIITVKYEIETEHNNEDVHVVKSIAKAVTEGGEQNIDDQTTFEVKELTWTKYVPQDEDLLAAEDDATEVDDTAHAIQ